jgi:hypothetical protein
VPARSARATRSARAVSPVQTAPARPKSVLLPSATASSSLVNRSTVRMGPKVSSRTTVIAAVQPASTVGR